MSAIALLAQMRLLELSKERHQLAVLRWPGFGHINYPLPIPWRPLAQASPLGLSGCHGGVKEILADLPPQGLVEMVKEMKREE
ncbi:hypothetical protein CLAFUW4_04201 [Fulvia fulva]|uniref:Uncharacterized protein n=1 Tax=Passalora fulva TaxID=5499 RepID=A0A9Q8P876_PASFU|nr:uncharacterized protein CLAFUR5_04164 [Fulvia fulva]KAK4626602.1 hypothetical protein CLAFUR4_04187 [Fulvia fulva]KAK4627816.1 hypothetical protein CLAFUR0_04187 [Fulvia fulva]UJO16813.1 hypothetical protein CLAFUR5_04164 [Fulvia fulva]WPV14305.1 hypothetical protein CLAFUW4_04201 [Fulvia fulva]WPV28204.1 hypothetical protein CLAFUW7_04190 [Fulvia fulva]